MSRIGAAKTGVHAFFKRHPYVTDFTVGGIAANAAWDAGKAGYTKTKERAENKHPAVKGGF